MKLLDDGPHQWIGQPDRLAAVLGAEGQRQNYIGHGRIVIQPIWRFDNRVPADTRAGVLDYLGMIQQLERDYAARGVIVVGALAGGEAENRLFQQAISGRDWTFEYAVDGAAKIRRAYSVAAYPTLVLVDRDGIVDAVYTGWSDCLETLLRDDLDRLTGGVTR